jgi:hypothetical protein
VALSAPLYAKEHQRDVPWDHGGRGTHHFRFVPWCLLVVKRIVLVVDLKDWCTVIRGVPAVLW